MDERRPPSRGSGRLRDLGHRFFFRGMTLPVGGTRGSRSDRRSAQRCPPGGGLAVGDNVRAYGSKTVYKGLVELTGINGGNADEFSILSSGNELPLAVKTIAEINSDFSANNLLQSTRVKIENAIVGTINPSGTTVTNRRYRLRYRPSLHAFDQ